MTRQQRRGLAVPSRLARESSRRQFGVTLVEVLVTLVVMSVGLLGVAALHTFTLKSNQDALVRGLASALSQDIIDRMRGNREMAKLQNYDIALGAAVAAPGLASPIYQVDLYNWKTRVAASLPNGQCSVARGATMGSGRWLFTITIQWSNRSADAGTNTVGNSSFVTTVEI